MTMYNIIHPGKNGQKQNFPLLLLKSRAYYCMSSFLKKIFISTNYIAVKMCAALCNVKSKFCRMCG